MAKTKVKAGRLIVVKNKDKKAGANPNYISVWVEDSDGTNERCLLFTEHQILEAQERAAKNPEDLTKKSLMTDICD